MKSLIKLTTGLFICSFLFFSCNKDDDNDSSDNYFKVGDVKYSLSKGVIENYGSYDDNSYNFDILLLSSDFTIYLENGYVDSISGTGNAVYFELFTSTSDNLALGDYEYDSEFTDDPGTFNDAEVYIDFDTETEEGSGFYITSGTLTVSQNSDVFEISFESDIQDLTMYYKGSLIDNDYTEYYSNTTKSFKVQVKTNLLSKK